MKKNEKIINLLNVFIILLLVIYSCNNKKQTSYIPKKNQLIDTIFYKYSGSNYSRELLLMNNKSFIFRSNYMGSTGSGEFKIVKGKYITKKNTLILNPTIIDLTINKFDLNNKKKQIKVKYGIDSLKIKTEFTIVKWNKYTYLLSDVLDIDFSFEPQNDFERFAKDYNSGWTEGQYFRSLKEFSTNAKLNLKIIPEKWRNLFLENIIIANVIKVEKNENFWINKGEKDHIMKGLSLSTKDGNKFIEIEKVYKNSSMGKCPAPEIYDTLKIGDELRTKWEN